MIHKATSNSKLRFYWKLEPDFEGNKLNKILFNNNTFRDIIKWKKFGTLETLEIISLAVLKTFCAKNDSRIRGSNNR